MSVSSYDYSWPKGGPVLFPSCIVFDCVQSVFTKKSLRIFCSSEKITCLSSEVINHLSYWKVTIFL